MTRRERLERKLEKRREWADKRTDKANAVFQRAERYRGDHAFNTQPGHIPERARLIKAEERAFGDMQMANHHTSCAAGIERALDRSIFSDDNNAIEALEARIAEHEATRTTMREANKIVRANPKNERTDDKVTKLVALGLSEAKAISLFTADFCGRFGFADYELSNLGGRITTDRKRLEYLKQQKQTREQAEASPNGITLKELSGGYCVITFAEKPAREILNALRSAGYRWSAPSWVGTLDKLPSEVKELLQPTTEPSAEAPTTEESCQTS
jgi:hypothetical protein